MSNDRIEERSELLAPVSGVWAVGLGLSPRQKGNNQPTGNCKTRGRELLKRPSSKFLARTCFDNRTAAYPVPYESVCPPGAGVERICSSSVRNRNASQGRPPKRACK